MKIKGRRQSDNVVDIREPRAAAKYELNRQASDPMETQVRQSVNEYLARGVQDAFERDKFAAEMLLGPRWKD